MPEIVKICPGKTGQEVPASFYDVFRRKVEERCGLFTAGRDARPPVIALGVRAGMGEEGFRIEDGCEGEVRIAGNDLRGCFYGMGKFLRDARYEKGRFIPGKWRGVSVPEKKVRGIYLATHFHNYFHDAPMADVERYIEDLALWGFNHLLVWFDRHHYHGINDPAARVMIARLRALLQAGKKIGMKVGLTALANEGYADSPAHLRADGNTGRAHYGVELCPSKPGATALILREFEEEFDAFSDVQPDFLSLWPYDQGGCACPACKPWGCNGYLRIGEQVARLFKKLFSSGKVILSTWLFDCPYKTNDEWEGLSRAFIKKPDWVDCLLADSHDNFPKYPLVHGAPGGLPIINFPEISMWKMTPWGGFGANPLPARFQGFWDEVKSLSAGGFPYLEGIFADINQVLYGAMYWSKDRPDSDALREYISFEFSPDVVEDVLKAVTILERNHGYSWLHDRRTGQLRGLSKNRTGTEEALALLSSADRRLPDCMRMSWRWRILYLRALLDDELSRNQEVKTDRCEEALEELTRIYHAQKAEFLVQPPSRKNLESSGYEPKWFHRE